ncbi:DUF5988 family protein [Streptomyces sp. NPDC059913]|uniref:DUF5988 family protein n=1 Tax=unclassified Streptomyces TaxID=2593676 RepID=UPI003317AFC9
MSVKEVSVLLCGGPLEGAPESERLVRVSDPQQTFKLFKGNRYEHFLPSSESRVVSGQEVPVFLWSHRTFVAE